MIVWSGDLNEFDKFEVTKFQVLIIDHLKMANTDTRAHTIIKTCLF